jgi:hypothetical protein
VNRYYIVGINVPNRSTLGYASAITVLGLLLVTITLNSFLSNPIRGQTIIPNLGESDSNARELFSNNDICDFDSENPFSSNALSEKLRDELCDEDGTLARESDDSEIEEDEETDNSDSRDRFQAKLQELRDRFEEALSEEEEEDQPLPEDEQKEVEEQDQIAIREHKSENDKDCKDGNVLEGASNAEDLKVLTECQEAVGEVVHTKKMNDGDYKFLLNVENKYKYLLNEKNNDKTDGYLIVEIVPPDQGKSGVLLPKEGDHVHIWGAWVTDKPKGWHEIHPTWKVVNE